jgi:hypothetical protein
MPTGIGACLVAVVVAAVASSNVTALITGKARVREIQAADFHSATGPELACKGRKDFDSGGRSTKSFDQQSNQSFYGMEEHRTTSGCPQP